MRTLFVILFFFCFSIASASDYYGDAECRIVEIIDGDTIRCNIPEFPDIIGKDILIRFRDINTPEIRGNERPLGLISKSKLKNLLKGKDKVTLKNMGRDKYFRIDADIYDGETKINTAYLMP